MVVIRDAKPGDLKQLINVYREEYGKGHVLHEEDVQESLAEKQARYLVCVDNNVVVGGVGVMEISQGMGHSVFKLNHFAVLKQYAAQGVAGQLLNEAEKKVKHGKIEIFVSEKETPDVEFYMKQGYSIEGELTNHYSMNETCFVLGKTI
jgi:ribosomal protein S18 acetylase RimI-like enzyme